MVGVFGACTIPDHPQLQRYQCPPVPFDVELGTTPAKSFFYRYTTPVPFADAACACTSVGMTLASAFDGDTYTNAVTAAAGELAHDLCTYITYLLLVSGTPVWLDLKKSSTGTCSSFFACTNQNRITTTANGYFDGYTITHPVQPVLNSASQTCIR